MTKTNVLEMVSIMFIMIVNIQYSTDKHDDNRDA